jgi:pentatricopeptide repeat protein
MALRIKDDMLSAGVTPNTVAWSSLINACANAGLVEHSIQLFEEMLQAGCEPNTQCCNILLHACVEACQYDRAFRLFQSWKENRVMETTDGDCSKNIYSNLNVENADEECSTSMANCVSNSHHLNFTKKFPFTPTTTTYNILMKACGSDYYHARALMDEMKTVALSPNHISWSILIDICGGLRNVEGAIQVVYKLILIYFIFAVPFCIFS